MSFLGHWNEAGCFPKHWHSLRAEAQVEEVVEKEVVKAGVCCRGWCGAAGVDQMWLKSPVMMTKASGFKCHGHSGHDITCSIGMSLISGSI